MKHTSISHRMSYRMVVAQAACLAVLSVTLVGCSGQQTQQTTPQPTVQNQAQATATSHEDNSSLAAKEDKKSHELAMSISPTKSDPTDPAGIFFNDIANSLDSLDIKVERAAGDETQVDLKAFAGQAKGLYREYQGKLNAYQISDSFTTEQKDIAKRIIKELDTCYSEYAAYYQDMLQGKVQVPHTSGGSADENIDILNKLYDGKGNEHGDAGYRARVAAERALAEFKSTLKEQ